MLGTYLNFLSRAQRLTNWREKLKTYVKRLSEWLFRKPFENTFHKQNHFSSIRLIALFHKYLNWIIHISLTSLSLRTWTIFNVKTQRLFFRLLRWHFHQQHPISWFTFCCLRHQAQYTSFMHWLASLYHTSLFYVAAYTLMCT